LRKFERDILKKTYNHFLESGSPTFYYSFSAENQREVINALDNLYGDGYIKSPRRALNSSYVTLTDYGIDFATSL